MPSFPSPARCSCPPTSELRGLLIFLCPTPLFLFPYLPIPPNPGRRKPCSSLECLPSRIQLDPGRSPYLLLTGIKWTFKILV